MTNRQTNAADAPQSEKPGFLPRLKEASINLAQQAQGMLDGLQAGVRSHIVETAFLAALTPAAMAANAPNAPTVAPVAATASAQTPESTGKFSEVRQDTPRTRYEIGQDGATISVAMAEDLSNMAFFLEPGAKLVAQAKEHPEAPLEFMIVAILPPDAKNPEPRYMKLVNGIWETLGASGNFYYFESGSMIVPIGNLTDYPGVVICFGYASGPTLQDRLNKVVADKSYDQISLTPLPKLASLNPLNVAEPGTRVTSDPIAVSQIPGMGNVPRNVFGVGAKIIVTPLNGQQGEPTETAVIQPGDTVQMVGTTSDEPGANSLMKIVVEGVGEIPWTVTNQKAPNTTPAPETETPEISIDNPAPAPETETPEISITDNPAPAPETVKMPETPEIIITDLGDYDHPREFHGTIKLVIPKEIDGKVVAETTLTRVVDHTPISSATYNAGEDVMPSDTDICKFIAWDKQGDPIKIFYAKILPPDAKI